MDEFADNILLVRDNHDSQSKDRTSTSSENVIFFSTNHIPVKVFQIDMPTLEKSIADTMCNEVDNPVGKLKTWLYYATLATIGNLVVFRVQLE